MWGYEVAADGSLTELAWSPQYHPEGAASYGKSLTPDGKRLYFAYFELGQARGYDVTPSGDLEEIEGSPWTLAEGTDALMSFTFLPNGQVAYVPLWEANAVLVVDVAADGTLTRREAPVPTVEGPAPLAVSRDGELLFVLGQAGAALEVFTLSADGTPTPAGEPATFHAPAHPQGLALTF